MSTVYLVPDDPKFDAVGFDVTMNEEHTSTTTATANPVEDGSVVNDHLIHEPDTFACQVLVTNTPLRTTFYGDGDTRLVDVTVPQFEGRGVVIPSQSKLLGFTGTRDANLVDEMHKRLEALRLAGALMTVLTSTKTYDTMILTSVGLPRGQKTIGQGTFSLSFVKLKIVQTQTVRAPKPKEKRAFGGQAIGSDAPKDSTGDKLNKSWLKQGYDKGPDQLILDARTLLGI
jgi:hypothetical protein